MLRRNLEVVGDPATLRAEIERRTALTELQNHPALTAAQSERERLADRELAEWERDQDRSQRRRQLTLTKRAERREQRTTARLEKVEQQDRLWLQQALSARRRASTPDAQLARVFRRNTVTARTLYGVVLLGMAWAAINVQANLVPDRDPSNPLFWLSFGIEAMFSLPLILIMIHAQTAADLGETIERGKIVVLEIALLGGSIALNAGPHYAAGEIGKGLEYSAAPVMIGVAIWLHAWLSQRYASLIGKTLARTSHASGGSASQASAPHSPAALPLEPAPTGELASPAAAVGASQPPTIEVEAPALSRPGPPAHADAANDADGEPVGISQTDPGSEPTSASAPRTDTALAEEALDRPAHEDATDEAASSRRPAETDARPAPVEAVHGLSQPRTARAHGYGASDAPHPALEQIAPTREPALAGATTTGVASPALNGPANASTVHSAAAVVRALPRPNTDDSPDEFDQIAHRIVAAEMVKKKTPEQVATVLRMLDAGRPHAEITRATATGYSGGIHHKTIKNIAAAAEQVKVPVRAVR